MKKIGLILIAVVVGVALYVWFVQRNNTVQQMLVNTQSPTSVVTEPVKQFTVAEVGQHSRAQDCWMIVNDGVYDVTEYAPRHPGGPDKILGLCGKDGTILFIDQHGGNQRAESMLARLKIGKLKK